jgi:signal peptidase I
MKLDQTSLLILVVTIAAAAAWALYAFGLSKRAAGDVTEETKEPVWVEYSQFVFAVGLIVLMIRVFDLATVLLTLTVFTGVIWGGFVLFKLSRGRTHTVTPAEATAESAAKAAKEPIAVEFSRFLFPVVFIVLIVRSFVVEPFQIPSESMLPTLEKGDFILVNRFEYGLRMPVFDFKLLALGTPRRGDVIVFRYPENPSVDYIKRVVGLPGDRIRYVNKHIYINDQPVEYTMRGIYVKQPDKHEYVEKLGSMSHDILLKDDAFTSLPFLPEGQEVTVPPHKYFAMGDNRDNSSDSRAWGFVPDENLKGRAFYIWFSWKEGHGPKWKRIGTPIK